MNPCLRSWSNLWHLKQTLGITNNSCTHKRSRVVDGHDPWVWMCHTIFWHLRKWICWCSCSTVFNVKFLRRLEWLQGEAAGTAASCKCRVQRSELHPVHCNWSSLIFCRNSYCWHSTLHAALHSFCSTMVLIIQTYARAYIIIMMEEFLLWHSRKGCCESDASYCHHVHSMVAQSLPTSL